MDAKITNAVDELKFIYTEVAPEYAKHRSFKKATDEEITAFEKRIGEKLPDDLTTFLKHNEIVLSYDFGYDCLSLAEIISTWDMMREHLENGVFDDGRIEHHEKEGFGNWDRNYIKKVWWSTKWIPFAEDGCGNTKCIDLDPGKRGNKYQVLSMEIQDGQGPFIDRNYKSFSAYLNAQMGYYKNKQYNLVEYWKGGMRIYINSDVEPRS